MKRYLTTIFAALILLTNITPPTAYAATLSQSLLKTFKSSHYPYPEQLVEIEISTTIPQLPGKNRQQNYLQAAKVHDKIVHHFQKNSWRPKQKFDLSDIQTKGVAIEMEEGMNLRMKRTFRLFLYLNMCEHPRRKFRGDNIEEFLQSAVEDSENCLANVHELQSRNYPY